MALVSGARIDTGFASPAQDGKQWLDLTGTGVSTGTRGVIQTVATIAGASYSLSFWVGNVSDSRSADTPGGTFGVTSTVGLKINGTAAGSYTNSAPGMTLAWQQFTHELHRHRQLHGYRVRQYGPVHRQLQRAG